MDSIKNKILVINHDEDVRKCFSDCLSYDYVVDTLPSFQEAMNLVNSQDYKIVIAEIDTPEVKGIEIVRKLKEIKSDLPLIVLTTYQSVPLAVEAMKIGAYDYITRPLNYDELKLVILHVLELQKLVEEVKEKKIYEELALIDGLTHVYNRRYLDELLSREIKLASRYLQQFSFMMLDLDDFKKHNDAYGHQGGDKLLKETASVLLRKIRNTDYIARYGGEEFAVICPHTDNKGALALAARILDTMANNRFSVNDTGDVGLTVSIGIATFGGDITTAEDLIKRADDALYQAKRLGKNRVCMFGTKD